MTKNEHFQLIQEIKNSRCKDQFSLIQRAERLNRLSDASKLERQRKSLIKDIEKSQQWVASRKLNANSIRFDEVLPINQKREEIAQLINNNQIVILAGETGSGKTTQIPKILLSQGYGQKGLIGHTQPRRIAARTVANRIAEELDSNLGDLVGYQVRFNDQVSEKSQLKLMTDGVLLAELQRDRYLNQYEVIIIDEAHERSLNIDFLLGLLKRLLKNRPDLKLIITSATIDLEKFSTHFDHAPIIEVSGRTYPVEVIYQADVFAEHQNEQNSSVEMDLPQTICHTVEHIIDNERRGDFIAQGDILVFCSGEREIREAAQSLQDNISGLDVLPLYARLSLQEQTRVFKPSKQRKVVLATNVAETSITVPGIAYVIDPGFARISRYNFRSKVQGLPIEKISQASANQRMGRCGRVANGVCIRLYSEEDFISRAEFTEAEILRSNLASVILQMLQMGIHNIQHFPFLDQPDRRLLNDGFKLLEELQAVEAPASSRQANTSNSTRRLSNIGHKLSQLPVDPKYARILFEANKRSCLNEVIIIVAALSIQDPREWPADKRQSAQEKHAVINHQDSDFLSYLNLWEAINLQRKALSNKQFKLYCQKHFLSIVRIFEWRDVVGQLSKTVKQIGWKIKPNHSANFLSDQQLSVILSNNNSVNEGNKKTKPKQANQQKQNKQLKQVDQALNTLGNTIHQALLSGLLGNIACRDNATQSKNKHNASHSKKSTQKNDFTAARGRQLLIFPTSALSSKRNYNNKKTQLQSDDKQKTSSQWIIANELMETSRLYAVTCGRIQAEWINEAGSHLLNFSYSNPEYHQKQGVVKARRKSSLYGLNLPDSSSVVYSDIDPKTCREIFIQRALVEGLYALHPQIHSKQDKNSFFTHNQEKITHIESIEAKTRRRNLLISDIEYFNRYDEIIPADIVNHAGFEHWRKQAEQENPQLLHFSFEQLTSNALTDNKLNTLLLQSQNEDSNQETTAPQEQFPNSLNIQGKTFPLSYHFNPDDTDDGVTLTLPAELLAPFPDHIGSWLVPGLLREKCIALIKTLPKQYRKLFAPAANAVDRILPNLRHENIALHLALGEQLSKTTGHKIPTDAWQIKALDPYYLLNFRIQTTDDTNQAKEIHSRDLQSLKQQFSQFVTQSLSIENAPERQQFERESITEWDFELPNLVSYEYQGMTVQAYPMLLSSQDKNQTQEEKHLKLSLHESSQVAEFFTNNALVDLAMLDPKSHKMLKQSMAYLQKEIFKPKSRQDNIDLKLLSLAPNKAKQNTLKHQIILHSLRTCCFDEQIKSNHGLKHADIFYQCIQQGQKQWVTTALDTESLILKLSELYSSIKQSINSINSRDEKTDQTLEEIKDFIYELMPDSFIAHTSLDQLKHYPRYLKVIQKRLDNIHLPTPDEYLYWRGKADKLIHTEKLKAKELEPKLKENNLSSAFVFFQNASIEKFHIMLHEWHCSLFAQELKTRFPISRVRIEKFWNTHFDT